MSFQAKLEELSALGAEIAQARHRIGCLEIDRKEVLPLWPPDEHDERLRVIDRKLLAERLDLHLAETRRDVLRLELTWSIADRSAGALLDMVDLEDVAP